MNKMEDVFKRLEIALKDANTHLDEIEPGKRPGWAMRIAAGQQTVQELTVEYKMLLSAAITKKIFVTGDSADVQQFFLHVGELGLDGLATDASTMYRRITDGVAGSMGMRGEFSLSQFSLMNSAVGDIAVENQELEVKDAVGEFIQSISSYDQLLAHVRKCFRATNGDKINAALMNKRVVKQAMATELNGPTVLFIRGAQQEEMADLSLLVVGGPSSLLPIPTSPTLEWTTQVLAELGLLGEDQIPEQKTPEKKPRKPRGSAAVNPNPTNTEEN